MNNIDYKKIKAWPFQEAVKLKNKVSKIANKKLVTLETGYGPSGDPHIGTFAEVLRTNMVLNCLKEISYYSTNLIAFSDDLDALRKVPEDYPFPDKLKDYINSPLSMIPDFTGQYESYADRNNNLLKSFFLNKNFSCSVPISQSSLFFSPSLNHWKTLSIFNVCLLSITNFLIIH